MMRANFLLHIHNNDQVKVLCKWDNLPDELPNDYATITLEESGITVTLFLDKPVLKMLDEKLQDLLRREN